MRAGALGPDDRAGARNLSEDDLSHRGIDDGNAGGVRRTDLQGDRLANLRSRQGEDAGCSREDSGRVANLGGGPEKASCSAVLPAGS